MRRRFQSHRFRRRLLWGVGLAGTTAVVVGSIVIGNTAGGSSEEATRAGPPVVDRAPKTFRLTTAQRSQFLAASVRFVNSAVTRKNVDVAYDLVSPSLRQGLTRKQWHTGNIPVVPFPAVSLVTWQVDWSYSNDIGIDLALMARKRSDTVGKTFTIELKRYGQRWLVESWTPKGVSGPGNVRSISREVASTPPPRARLGAGWLLVPAAVFSLLLLLPLGLGVRSWRAGRRAIRAYEAERNAPRPFL